LPRPPRLPIARFLSYFLLLTLWLPVCPLFELDEPLPPLRSELLLLPLQAGADDARGDLRVLDVAEQEIKDKEATKGAHIKRAPTCRD
jgi:hypothetical protein